MVVKERATRIRPPPRFTPRSGTSTGVGDGGRLVPEQLLSLSAYKDKTARESWGQTSAMTFNLALN